MIISKRAIALLVCDLAQSGRTEKEIIGVVHKFRKEYGMPVDDPIPLLDEGAFTKEDMGIY